MKILFNIAIIALAVINPIVSFGINNSSNSDTISVYPQKVVLITDKDEYFTNETIWFNAYVLNSNSNKPDTLSRNLYVDIVDYNGKIVVSRILRLNNGLAYGDFFINDSIHDGNYMITAYTEWVRAMSDPFVFTKNIYIHNIEQSNYISRRSIQNNKAFNAMISNKRNSHNIDFFPEGGSLISGSENQVIIRVLNQLNETLSFQARVYDNNDKFVTDVDVFANGYGVFSLKPLDGISYYANVIIESKDEYKANLPLSTNSGVSLNIHKNDDGDIIVKAVTSESLINEKFALLLKFGQEDNFINELIPNKDYVFSTDFFPSGITRFIAYDKKGKVYSQRLFFVNDNNFFNVELARNSFMPGIELSVPLKFISNKDKFVSGNFSFALYNLNECKDNNYSISENLKNQLLVNSSQAGLTIENDFDLNSAEDIKRLNLMLIASNAMPDIDYSNFNLAKEDFEKHFPSSLKLSGAISSNEDHRVATESFTVILSDLKGSIRKAEVTKGQFYIPNLYYEGSFKINLQITDRRNAGRAININVTLNEFESLKYKIDSNTKYQSITEKGPNWKNRNPWYKRLFSSSDKSSVSRSDTYFNPDQIIYMDEIANKNYTNMYQVITNHVHGLYHDQSGRLMFRGPSSIRLSSEPIFLIDGTIVDRSHFFTMNVNAVERIDAFRGASASIFGARGANGAIVAYTRRSHFFDPTTIEFELMGYLVPSEFEIPQGTVNVGNEHCKTIFYNPSVVVSNRKEVNLNIPVKLPEGDYVIVFQGIDNDGVPVFSKLKFNVLK
ncbi:MAG: TonB-dependent receptor plug domain-containing protein [Bacteroidetes bacterium]|nr:TonB-dependent receptor plug domain-containing protein [Bacteroidota bacterium]